MVDDIAIYLSESDDPESLIKLYESMFPNTKVVYEDENIFTVAHLKCNTESQE